MKPRQIKLEARERIAQILRAALDVAEKVGYNRMTRDEIAALAGIPPTLINYHMGTMPDLRRDVMREALRNDRQPLDPYRLAHHDRHAMKAPEDLRRLALQTLGG